MDRAAIVHDNVSKRISAGDFPPPTASFTSGQAPAWDMLLSFVACCEDPISGGRHKVLGRRDLVLRRDPGPTSVDPTAPAGVTGER